MHAVSEGVESVVEDREVESDHESKAHVQFLLFLCNQYQLFPCSYFLLFTLFGYHGGK